MAPTSFRGADITQWVNRVCHPGTVGRVAEKYLIRSPHIHCRSPRSEERRCFGDDQCRATWSHELRADGCGLRIQVRWYWIRSLSRLTVPLQPRRLMIAPAAVGCKADVVTYLPGGSIRGALQARGGPDRAAWE
jgi:hypothetical protein